MTAKGRGIPRPFQGDAMKKFPLLLALLLLPVHSFSADLLTMVRDPQTYEWTLQTLNNPAVRTSIVMAAEAIPAAAAAVGVTVTSGVTLPLAGAVLGTAWLAQDLYNRQAIKREWYNQPQYAEMSPTASAKDFICQPAHITLPVNTVTPDSFPNATEQLIGRPLVVSAPAGEFIEQAKASSDPTLQPLKDIINANTVQGGLNGSGIPTSINGQTITTNTGQNVVLGNSTGSTGMDPAYVTSQLQNRSPRFTFSTGGGCYSTTGTVNGSWECSNMSSWNGTWLAKIWFYNGSATANPATFTPSPNSTNWPAMRDALKNYFQTNPDTIATVLKDIDAKLRMFTDKAPTATDPLPRQQTGPISQQELNNWYTTNNQNVANYNTTNITNNSTTQEIAKGVAATTAAQAAKQDFPDKIVFTGSANLPPDNVYDPTITQPEENSFVDKVHAFINSGLPVLSSIKGSGLTASGSPSMSTTIWNHPVVVDFSDQQTVLRAAGSVLVIISLIVAYCIIVRS